MTGAAVSLVLMAAAQVYAPGSSPGTPAPSGKDRSGAEVFATVCAMCHITETPGLRAPSVDALRRLSHANITDALTIGAMTDVGNDLSDKEIEAVADFLTTPPAKPTASADKG